ncbi:MAG: hypothetical protein QGG42_18940 [Phycisphaerae bacterium]|jgi:tetratricopeptide (TPR) repeat protein|nr:hypothetical protein [Phycisphaerae bacterium]
MKHSVGMLGFALVLLTLSPPVPADDKAPFPLIENYSGAGGHAVFLNDALTFVRKNLKSPHAPRVLFDAYMLATLGGQRETATTCKTLLLVNYADSAYSRHVLNGFPDGLAYKNFVDRVMFCGFAKLSDETAKGLAAGFRRGLLRFGYKHFTGRFALKCILIARQAGADDLARDIAGKLKKDNDDEENKLVDLCLRDGLTPLDRILKLNEMIAMREVAMIIEHFLRQLPEAQRGDSRIVRIGIHTDVCAKRFAEALKTIETLSGKELDPQILHWKGRCLFAAGKRPEAIKALKQAREIAPKSPWAQTSAKLAGCIENYGANMLTSVDMFLAWSKKFRAEAEIIELDLVTSAGGAKTPYRIYFGSVMTDEIIEIVLFKKDTVMVAYRSAPDGMRIYSSSSNEIVSFPNVQMVPMFSFSVARRPDGGFTTDIGFKVGKSLQQSIEANRKGWNSPYITTKAGLLDYRCSEAVRLGHVPASIIRKGDTMVVRYTFFDTNDPGTSDVELHVNDRDVLTAVRSSFFQTRKIRYGRKTEMKLSSPKWPNVKVRTAGKSEIPFAALTGLFGEFTKMAAELTGEE